MRRNLVMLTVVALCAVACGDDSDSGQPAATTTTTTAPVSTSAEPTTTTAAPATTGTTATTATTTTTSPPRPTTSTTAPDPSPEQCGSVAFTPDSEDAASEITAVGLSCDEAEAFVRVAGGLTSSGGPPELEVDGYRCVRTRSEEDPLPRSFYECTNGALRVTFARS